jgi:carboxymethylenebutenolidase
MYETDMYEGMLTETVSLQGLQGEPVHAYCARPLGPGQYPGLVLLHHLRGWGDWERWVAQEFATHGFVTLAPQLEPRIAGGLTDARVVGAVDGAFRYLRALPYSSGKVGCFGTSAGGRYTVLAASRVDRFHAAVDCWGGQVVMTPEDLTSQHPVAPIDLTPDLKCPLLGLFGEEDQAPTLAQVEQHEEALKQCRKTYTFYRYAHAGHDFFDYTQPSYRRAAAVNGWEKVFTFLDKYLR